jgi:branched-chain amino acid transport system substrate-binding protein
MVFQEINDAGGVNIAGTMMELEAVYVDTGSSASQVLVAYEQLITQDEVVAIIGPVTTTEVLAIPPVLNTYKIVNINYSALAPTIADGSCIWSFHAIGNWDMAYGGMTAWLCENVKPNSAACLAMSAAGTTEGAIIGEQVFAHYGIPVTSKNYTLATETDYTTVLTKIRAENPEFILCTYYPAHMGQMLQQASQMGYRPPKGFASLLTGCGAQDCVDICGIEAAANTYHMAGLYERDAYPRSLTFEQEWMDYTGGLYGMPTLVITGAFDTIYMLKAALEMVPSIGQDLTSQEALRQALLSLDHQGLQGRILFTPTGQAIPPDIIGKRFADGSTGVVGIINPDDYAQFCTDTVIPADVLARL